VQRHAAFLKKAPTKPLKNFGNEVSVIFIFILYTPYYFKNFELSMDKMIIL